VLATRIFQTNEVICDYNGELLNHKEGNILDFIGGSVYIVSPVFCREYISYLYLLT